MRTLPLFPVEKSLPCLAPPHILLAAETLHISLLFDEPWPVIPASCGRMRVKVYVFLRVHDLLHPFSVHCLHL